MIRHTAKQLFVGLTLLLFVFTFSVWAQDATPEGDDVLIDQAYINDVTVTDDWIVEIEGELGDSCTNLGEITQEVDGNTITITVNTTRPADLMCAMQLETFDTIVPLDAAAVTEGETVIIVNGTEYPVTLPELVLPTCDELEADEGQEKFENNRFCFLYPDSYDIVSNRNLVLLGSESFDGDLVTFVVEIAPQDDIESLEDVKVALQEAYPEVELEFEDVLLNRNPAFITESISILDIPARRLYMLWDERIIMLEIQPIEGSDALVEAVDELWTMITDSWILKSE
jgi:hypothetical protein